MLLSKRVFVVMIFVLSLTLSYAIPADKIKVDSKDKVKATKLTKTKVEKKVVVGEKAQLRKKAVNPEKHMGTKLQKMVKEGKISKEDADRQLKEFKNKKQEKEFVSKIRQDVKAGKYTMKEGKKKIIAYREKLGIKKASKKNKVVKSKVNTEQTKVPDDKKDVKKIKLLKKKIGTTKKSSKSR